MVSIEEALNIVLEQSTRLPVVTVPVLESLGMVFAEDVHSITTYNDCSTSRYKDKCVAEC